MLRSRKIRGLIFGGVPEWSKGADCKSAGSTFGGSNPPPSTNDRELGTRDWVLGFINRMNTVDGKTIMELIGRTPAVGVD